MIKRFIAMFLLSSLFIQVYALDNRMALELFRTKKTDTIVKRVNNIYEFINLYIMQTGTAPADLSALTTRFANINTEALNGGTIAFAISNNIVTFTNVIPSSSSDLVKQHYSSNPQLDVNAVVNPDLSMGIGLKAQTIKFLTYVSRIEALDANALISETSPVCNAGTNLGNLWYQPDTNGGFNISYCAPDWTLVSNKINISIFENSEADLNRINPPNGTKGYALDPSGDVFEFIYHQADGQWKKVEN